jgi:hypothetical protein
LVVVVVVVVVVAAAGDVVVVVAVAAVVVVVRGADVPLMTCKRASSVDDGTFGNDAEAGPNARVINWLLRSLRLAGAEVYRPPTCLVSLPPLAVVVDRVHERARTTPTLPASGVPAAHLSPFL